MKAALYARVSTLDQEPENQLQELRRYVEARGWTAREYVDHGISGAKDKRPALDELVRDAKRRRFDVLVCWKLDRLGVGRNLKHLITLLDELAALGIAFVSLGEGIDATTPAGKLQFHILAAIAEFERARLRERTIAGLQRAKAQGSDWGDRAEHPQCQFSRASRCAKQQLAGRSRNLQQPAGWPLSEPHRRIPPPKRTAGAKYPDALWLVDVQRQPRPIALVRASRHGPLPGSSRLHLGQFRSAQTPLQT